MSKVRQNIYTICFAVILGLVCAILLTAAAEFTRPRQLENQYAEEIRNILTALKIPFEPQATPAGLIEIFERDVKEEKIGQEPQLTLYVYKPASSDAVKAVAVSFIGSGLWAPIKGFLALEPDYKTIRGLSFYEQAETPGLGGDIVTEDFRSRFEGKQIMNPQDQWGIDIISSGAKVDGDNEIAGISGATMTCDKVEDMINAIIEELASKRQADGQ